MKDKGDEGEREIIQILKSFGVQKIRRPDIIWLHPITKKWYYFEVKNKEPFQPPPDWLQGFPQSQFVKDIHIDATGLGCIYVVRGKDNEWRAQYANLLNPIPDPPKANKNEALVWFKVSDFTPLKQFLREILKFERVE